MIFNQIGLPDLGGQHVLILDDILDTGLTLYTYPGLNGGGDKATWEPYLGINGSFGAVTSATYAYYDFTLDVFTLQETLGYSIPIDDKTSMNWSATAPRCCQSKRTARSINCSRTG